ncbi:MAG: hypothetical protein QOI03_1090 [Solirubrobacteraceae bacterium]|jgi:hypothetical protein|nr:hypothetical protein [Solirubrobacteraceae bacterium]
MPTSLRRDCHSGRNADTLIRKRSEERAQVGRLTHLSQTDRTAPDKRTRTGHLMDPGLRIQTTADGPDTRH